MCSKETVRGVVWDMDGTLLNTLEDIAGGLNQALRAWGLPEHSAHEALDGIGHGSTYLCQWASGLAGEALEKFTQEYRWNTVHLEHPRTQPYAGIPELISLLKSRGIKLGIYTNKPQGWTEQLVERFFGHEAFDMVLGTVPGGVLKPSAEGLVRMSRQWGIPMSEIVMVGDSEVDFETAKNAGCRPVIVGWGFGRRDLLEGLGAFIVDTSDELASELCESVAR